jgi:hypothetical protein
MVVKRNTNTKRNTNGILCTVQQAMLKEITLGSPICDYNMHVQLLLQIVFSYFYNQTITLFELHFPLNEANFRKWNLLKILKLIILFD